VEASKITKVWDALKGLASTVSSMVPAAATPYLSNIFPFLNPKIVEDSWLVTIIASAVSGLFFYFVSLPRANRLHPIWPAVCAVCIFFASLALLLAITGKVLSVAPLWEALLGRYFFICFFVGIAGLIGSVFARVLNLSVPDSEAPITSSLET
jgi:hypothetical protein